MRQAEKVLSTLLYAAITALLSASWSWLWGNPVETIKAVAVQNATLAATLLIGVFTYQHLRMRYWPRKW